MRIITYIILFFLFAAASPNDARKANEAFERGDYEEAVQLYRQALQQDPENARLHFNLGNALYRLGATDEAKESFDRFRSLTNVAKEQSFADYNTGRMLIDQEEYEEALSYFRDALRKNPDDADAKHNYELALRQQQEQQQQQQENDPESDPESGDQGDQPDNNQQDDQEPEQPDAGQQPNMPQDEEQDSEQPQPRPLEMTPEEAENILDALEQLERELLENQKKESTEPQRRNEKDW